MLKYFRQKTQNLNKKCLFILYGILFSAISYAQKNDYICANARNLVVAENFSQAITDYAKLAEKSPTNTPLLAEYAYVLALGGFYEGALMNLDRAKAFGKPMNGEQFFLISQIFTLMGHDELALGFSAQYTPGDIPKWLFPHYKEFEQKYKRYPRINQDSTHVAFKRANYLGYKELYYQSIILFREIINEYPNEYITYIGYSTVLDKVDLKEMAMQVLQTGISLMGNQEGSETKKVYEQRLSQLKQNNNADTKKTKPAIFKRSEILNPKSMFYVGGTFSSDVVSFNGRYGIFLSDLTNISTDVGIFNLNNQTSFNIGFSFYARSKWFMGGTGLGINIGETSSFNTKYSLGATFVNKNRNSSWDILFDIYVPLKEGAEGTFGISVGKSIYFGERGKK